MDKEKTLKKIDDLYHSADLLGIELIKQEARKILIADEDLGEFIMAMGGCFFTAKEGGKYNVLNYTDDEFDELSDNDFPFADSAGIMDDSKFQLEFMEMVDDLNEKFNSMGYPVRFKADTKEVYDWGDTIKDPIVYEKLNF